MKNVFYALAVFVFAFSVVSCTPEELSDDTQTAADPKEICPPNDRNCNGIPDDEEN